MEQVLESRQAEKCVQSCGDEECWCSRDVLWFRMHDVRETSTILAPCSWKWAETLEHKESLVIEERLARVTLDKVQVQASLNLCTRRRLELSNNFYLNHECSPRNPTPTAVDHSGESV